MKKLTLTMIITGLSLSAFSGTTCSTDILGNYNCSGTGQDFGYNSTTKRDFYGNDNYSDNYGNNVSCSTDFYGNYICN